VAEAAAATTTTNAKGEAVPTSEHVALNHSPNRMVGVSCTHFLTQVPDRGGRSD